MKIERSDKMQMQIDLEQMRIRLRKEQKILHERVEVERERVEPSKTANPDRADMAYDYAYRGRRMSMLEQLEDQLTEVNKALRRIDEGTYGICSNCGNAIMTERLEALPYAELCIECQRKEST
jgi:RNA polymerase-binding transcription factor